MKYTTEKPTKTGGYWVDGEVRQVFESSVKGLYWIDCGYHCYIKDLPDTTQYCLIPKPKPLDNFEKWWRKKTRLNQDFDFAVIQNSPIRKCAAKEIFEAGLECRQIRDPEHLDKFEEREKPEPEPEPEPEPLDKFEAWWDTGINGNLMLCNELSIKNKCRESFRGGQEAGK